ncbi:hypothetical protein WKI72_01960 [Candidatus Erwinia dacicola]
MMDEAEADVLAYFGFPKAHRVEIVASQRITGPLPDRKAVSKFTPP